jgi:hypothetical protein
VRRNYSKDVRGTILFENCLLRDELDDILKDSNLYLYSQRNILRNRRIEISATENLSRDLAVDDSVSSSQCCAFLEIHPIFNVCFQDSNMELTF